MPVPYEANGRSRQKQRTKAALVEAARELVADGRSPTVEDAAARAGISRTTAYRYFPSQHALLGAAHPETLATSLLPDDPPSDPAERLRLVMRAHMRILLATEAQQRTMLRLSLSEAPGELPLRQGRAIGWIEDALAPLRASAGAAAVRRLAMAIRSATGIESLVWLVDVGGLSRAQAAKVMCGNADAVLAAALR